MGAFLSNKEIDIMSIKLQVFNFCIDETGQGLIDYALIIAFIAIAAVGSVIVFGNSVLNLYEYAINEIVKMIWW